MAIALPTAENPVVLVRGDCLDVLRELPSGCVDAVVTDPPYGIYLKGGKWGKKFALQWDREPGNGVDIGAVAAVGRDAIIWGGNYFSLPPSRGWLVWRNPEPTL